jgi:hypothetical protein
MTKRKGTNNDLQNSAHKTKDRATQTTLKQAVNSGSPEGNTNIRCIILEIISYSNP